MILPAHPRAAGDVAFDGPLIQLRPARLTQFVSPVCLVIASRVGVECGVNPTRAEGEVWVCLHGGRDGGGRIGRVHLRHWCPRTRGSRAGGLRRVLRRCLGFGGGRIGFGHDGPPGAMSYGRAWRSVSGHAKAPCVWRRVRGACVATLVARSGPARSLWCAGRVLPALLGGGLAAGALLRTQESWMDSAS